MLAPVKLLLGPRQLQIATPWYKRISTAGLKITDGQPAVFVEAVVYLPQKLIGIVWAGDKALPFVARKIGLRNKLIDDLQCNRIRRRNHISRVGYMGHRVDRFYRRLGEISHALQC